MILRMVKLDTSYVLAANRRKESGGRPCVRTDVSDEVPVITFDYSPIVYYNIRTRKIAFVLFHRANKYLGRLLMCGAAHGECQADGNGDSCVRHLPRSKVIFKSILDCDSVHKTSCGCDTCLLLRLSVIFNTRRTIACYRPQRHEWSTMHVFMLYLGTYHG